MYINPLATPSSYDDNVEVDMEEENVPEQGTYKFKSVGITIRFDKHVDIPILHPLRHHREPHPSYRHAY